MMANKSKAKGTKAETKIVNYLLASGIKAERRALAGAEDKGDILCRGNTDFILEVKAGLQTKNYHRTKKEEWLRQTDREGRNAELPAWLVIAIHGKQIKDYEVWSPQGHLFYFLDDFVVAKGGKIA